MNKWLMESEYILPMTTCQSVIPAIQAGRLNGVINHLHSNDLHHESNVGLLAE